MTQNGSGRFYILAPTYKIAFMYADLNDLDVHHMHYISSRDKLIGLRNIEIIYVVGDQHGRYDPLPRRKSIEEMRIMEALKKITVKEVWLDTRPGANGITLMDDPEQEIDTDKSDPIDTEPD